MLITFENLPLTDKVDSVDYRWILNYSQLQALYDSATDCDPIKSRSKSILNYFIWPDTKVQC